MRIAAPLLLICLTACGVDQPGTPIDDADAYIGCYALPRGELIELSGDELFMKGREAAFQIEFRTDKWGDLAVATPGLWLEGGGSRELVDKGQNGSIIRFEDGDLSLPAANGESVRARRTACGVGE